ncbi:hypothetical protein MPSEU_000454600 [Mayamaea pseudoterrestris]|nr:hypothetical protein MPSEU_000454600 [Mayamaea pseudoterrestris]
MPVLRLLLLGFSAGSLAFQAPQRRFPNAIQSATFQTSPLHSAFFSVLTPPKHSSWTRLSATDSNDSESNDEAPKKKKKPIKKKPDAQPPALSKEDLVKSIGEQMRSKRQQSPESSSGADLLNMLNPFKAGQNLRKTIDGAITSVNVVPKENSIYYVGDRLMEGTAAAGSSSSELSRLGQDDFVPEVLVVGATGEVGRMVVRRLLLDGRFRVRVLVRDLYTETLNLLGTGVTYCQGDLANIDSLEYALTDVDKIVFCAGAPRPDEGQFQEKFKAFVEETLTTETRETAEAQLKQGGDAAVAKSNMEWEQLESVVQVRARLAEQVDMIGLQNLLRAYQNVRHADYGTSQAAKRSLFKFQDRPDDFNLFAIDMGDEEMNDEVKSYADYGNYYEEMDAEDAYGDEYDDAYATTSVELKKDTKVTSQAQWIRNQFEHGVFVGKVPKAIGTASKGGEAAIVSTRLRSRDDPENGIDLSAGFAGFILRLCSDGGKYEIFVRTKEFYEKGVEYVCNFSTVTKPTGKNKSSNKFVTVRCPFEDFKPVVRGTEGDSVEGIPTFRGQDVRNIGFRYSSSSNAMKSKLEPGQWSSFYLALCYMKLYRSQPEPEFVYLSDARIPPVVRSNMVSHATRKLLALADENEGVRLLDDATMKTVASDTKVRSEEETYYKFRGEEMIKSSGLSYSIIRVSGYNESPSGDLSTIDLSANNEDVTAVSRTDVAQVCVSALLDPNALNKSFYMRKKKGSSMDENIAGKFAALPKDQLVV